MAPTSAARASASGFRRGNRGGVRQWPGLAIWGPECGRRFSICRFFSIASCTGDCVGEPARDIDVAASIRAMAASVYAGASPARTTGGVKGSGVYSRNGLYSRNSRTTGGVKGSGVYSRNGIGAPRGVSSSVRDKPLGDGGPLEAAGVRADLGDWKASVRGVSGEAPREATC